MLALESFKRLGACVLPAVLAVLFTSCSREQAPGTPQYVDKPVVQDNRTHYTFSVHPLQNPQLLHEKFQPLMAYLASQLPDTTFDLDTSNDYADFERKLSTGVPHFALPNPYHAVKARDWGYHVIAKMGDDEKFRGIFIVRKDSPVKREQDLRGKVVSYPAPTALAAAMMPQLYLQNHGIDVETEITNTYVGTHNSSIMNAYLGQSAAGATWPVAWQAFEKANSKEASELYVIWQTPKLIQNAIVARNDVKPEVSARVQQLLATLHQSADGRALLANIDTENFEAANDAQFEVVVAFLKEYQTKVKKQR